jgi:hypothetical protein
MVKIGPLEIRFPTPEYRPNSPDIGICLTEWRVMGWIICCLRSSHTPGEDIGMLPTLWMNIKKWQR